MAEQQGSALGKLFGRLFTLGVLLFVADQFTHWSRGSYSDLIIGLAALYAAALVLVGAFGALLKALRKSAGRTSAGGAPRGWSSPGTATTSSAGAQATPVQPAVTSRRGHPGASGAIVRASNPPRLLIALLVAGAVAAALYLALR